LSILSAREGQYVVKILTGDLRIGLREGLVEEAIAKTFDVPLDDVKGANMLLGDIGATVQRYVESHDLGTTLDTFLAQVPPVGREPAGDGHA